MTPSISSFIPPVAPTPPVNAPAAPPQHSEFAQMLGQRQAMAREQNARASEPHPADKPVAPQAHSEAAPSAPTSPKAPADERQGAKADKPKASAAPDARQASPGEEAASPDKPAASDRESVDPALASWLAALNLPAPTLPAETPAAGGRRAAQGGEGQTDELIGGLGTGQATHAGGKGLLADAAQAAQRSDKALREPADARDKAVLAASGTPADAAWQAASEHLASPREAVLRVETPAVAAAGLAAHVPAARAPESAVVNLPTPVNSPEFAQTLGVQISVLARDGVQPAEMGPISVQIALDGTQAQVNFGADSAATRQLIENGLPELASALRDAGFTLSGGGVHSQAGGRGDGGHAAGGDGSGRSGSSAEAEVTPRRIQARVSAGGVDLYA